MRVAYNGAMLRTHTRLVTLVLAVAAFFLVTRATQAQTVGASLTPRSQAYETRWYGAPILVLDGVAVSFLAGATQTSDGTGRNLLLAAGFITYGLSGPIVHAHNSGYRKAAGSLLLRLGLPVLVGGGAYLAAGGGSNCEGHGCDMSSYLAGVAGLGVGMAGAMVIDYALLASKRVRTQSSALSLAPTYDPLRKATMLSISGTW